MTLGEIADVVHGVVAESDRATVVRAEAFVDSRRTVPGGLFAAVVGERVDGNDYAVTALRLGAAGALTSRHTGPREVVVPDVVAALGPLATHLLAGLSDLRVVGVTGSQGKTSTKDMLGSVLGAVAPTVVPEESLNNEIGVPLTVSRVTRETRFLVVEMGARGRGHIAQLAAMVRPSVGAVLNVGRAHLGEFGSRDAIAVAKGELVEALPASGVAVLNADDPRVDAMSTRTAASVLRFGSGPAADLRYRVVGLDEAARPSVELAWRGQRAEIPLAYVGAHQAPNAAAAATVALALGLEFDVVCDGLHDARPASHWRMEIATTASGATVVNDAYNANPDSMLAGLAAARSLVAGHHATRFVAVLGEMRELGDESEDLHRTLGRSAAEGGVDLLVTVGATAGAIADGADAVTGWTGRSLRCADPDSALDLLRGVLRQGDLVLVKASRAAGLERLATSLVSDRPANGQPHKTGGQR